MLSTETVADAAKEWTHESGPGKYEKADASDHIYGCAAGRGPAPGCGAWNLSLIHI